MSLQNPPCFHICVTDTNYLKMEEFVADLKDSVREAKLRPAGESVGTAAIYGMVQTVSDPAIIGDLATFFLDCLYQAY